MKIRFKSDVCEMVAILSKGGWGGDEDGEYQIHVQGMGVDKWRNKKTIT